jgi:hypothetical protein
MREIETRLQSQPSADQSSFWIYEKRLDRSDIVDVIQLNACPEIRPYRPPFGSGMSGQISNVCRLHDPFRANAVTTAQDVDGESCLTRISK